MWDWFWKESPPPPPMVLVPPLFDFPPLAARTSMMVPAYEILFGKMALQSLFEDYFEKAGHFMARIMLKPIDDPHVDLVATVHGALNDKKDGGAVFRWQRDLDDPHTFMELSVSTSEQLLQLKSCAYYPRYGLGFFGSFPGIVEKRIHAVDYGIMGMRYGSECLSVGTIFAPYPQCLKFRQNTCIVVSRELNLSFHSYHCQLLASFYQHIVVQRRVSNPLEQDQIVGITNYIDLGFELRTRIGDKAEDVDKSFFQIAASWQANKNILLKAKLGPCVSSAVLAFKSWWKPSFTFSLSAVNDRIKGATSYGFGIRIEDLREARYERADPNYVMLTQSKEHLADGVLRNWGKRPMFQSEIDSGNYDRLPRELKPIGKII